MFVTKRTTAIITLILLVALALSSCAPVAVPTSDTAATSAASSSATAPAAANSVNVVYDLPDLDGRTIVAATADDFTPFQYVDPQTGKSVGYEYDLVTEICARLNCVVDWQNSSWDAMIAAVNTGQFDIGMDGITITEERAQQVDFSVPYKTLQNFMLVRADEDRFTTPAEFAADSELLIGSQAGTTQFYTAVYDVLDGDEQNPRITIFENFGAAVQALIAGDVDMVLASAESGRGYIGANPDKLKIAGGEASHNFHMAKQLIDYGKVSYIQIDCGRIGGLGPAKRVADYAAPRGVTYVNHTFTSHLALCASLQPYAGLKEHVICEYPFAPKPVAWEMSETHLEPDANGEINVPQAPGLGIKMSHDGIKKYLVDVEISAKGKRLYETPEL